MSKRKGKSQSTSQKILWVLSLVIVGSMVISLFIVALPSGTERVPTPLPTLAPVPTNTLPPFPTLGPTAPPESSPEATAPPVGPLLPTSTGVFTPTLAPTEPPAGPVLPTTTP